MADAGDLRGYQRLKAWAKADDLAVAIVSWTRTFGRQDLWLATQIARSAASVPANIAEGYSRLSLREYLHHLSIARSSLAETEYWLHFMERLEILPAAKGAEFAPMLSETGNLLYGLIRSLARRAAAGPRQKDTYLISEPHASYGKDNQHDPDLSELDLDLTLPDP